MVTTIYGKKWDVYALDFETHNDEESIKNDTSSVWLGAIINEYSKIDDPASYVYSVEETLKRLEELTSKKRHHHNDTRPINNLLIYIYNLSFEWSFILPVLLKQGYKWNDKIDKDALQEKCYTSVSTHSCSSVWGVTLSLGNGSTIMIRDMAKIYGGGLRNVAESMKLDTQKGDIPYGLNRLHNYVVTDEEREYCFKDTRILIDILLKVKNDNVFWRSSSISTYACQNMINYGYRKLKYKMKGFRKDYPKPEKLEYDFLRKTVAGGITYAPESMQYKGLTNIKHIDAHQMHPTQAYIHEFPYGLGTYKVGQPQHPYTKISACQIRVSYTGVKIHSIIKCIGTNSIRNATLYVWDFEIPTMYKCYENLKIEYVDYYEYASRPLPWREFYKHNYDMRVIARAEGDDYNVVRRKKLNNASYGKLLERTHLDQYENIVNSKGIITSRVHESDKEELGAKYTALAVGSCIPAYSRVNLIETALLFGYKNVVYFDTDSIFYLDNEETREALKHVDIGDALGTWGIEPDIARFQVTAPKRYKIQLVKPDKKGNILDVKMAGINGIDISVPFDEINITSSVWEVKRAYRCKGGTLIKMQKKAIGVQKKYERVYNENQRI